MNSSLIIIQVAGSQGSWKLSFLFVFITVVDVINQI